MFTKWMFAWRHTFRVCVLIYSCWCILITWSTTCKYVHTWPSGQYVYLGTCPCMNTFHVVTHHMNHDYYIYTYKRYITFAINFVLCVNCLKTFNDCFSLLFLVTVRSQNLVVNIFHKQFVYNQAVHVLY